MSDNGDQLPESSRLRIMINAEDQYNDNLDRILLAVIMESVQEIGDHTGYICQWHRPTITIPQLPAESKHVMVLRDM